MQNEPMSLGGELPISRRCHANNHAVCRGSWTQYPDQSGPCECTCHQGAGPASDKVCHEAGEVSVARGRMPGHVTCVGCLATFPAFPHPVEGWDSAESPKWVEHVLQNRVSS